MRGEGDKGEGLGRRSRTEHWSSTSRTRAAPSPPAASAAGRIVWQKKPCNVPNLHGRKGAEVGSKVPSPLSCKVEWRVGLQGGIVDDRVVDAGGY